MTNAGSSWTELVVRVQPAASEAVADLLQELTGSGITIEPPIEALGPDEGYILDTEAPLRLHAYIYGDVTKGRRDTIRRRLTTSGLATALAGRIEWHSIREEDWAEAWKEHYDIERVGRVVVRPAWRQYSPAADEIVVHLDPGMAFGTGQHPTTRMCLQLAQELVRPGDRVLDLGAGSGILAIAAIGLGAESCVANDIEEQAVKAMIANVALNGLADRIDVRLGSLNAVANAGPYDLILANINAATVAALAEEMFGLLRPGREMAGGGIIEEREAACRAAVEAAGFVIERVLQDGDWRTLVCRKPS